MYDVKGSYHNLRFPVHCGHLTEINSKTLGERYLAVKAEDVANVLSESRWIGACLARSKAELEAGQDVESVARSLYEKSSLTLTRSREAVKSLQTRDFVELLDPRKRTGSAENPVTKSFPAAVTERLFLDELDKLCSIRRALVYEDERFSGHSLVDFVIKENGLELPINVKNAGTKFENAAQLVGLDPNDCIPIPAYTLFKVISARKAINILHKIPRRTPGIGLRAWGTGASAEINVHISVSSETKEWNELHARILNGGVKNIVEAVNRRRTELVFDPEI